MIPLQLVGKLKTPQALRAALIILVILAVGIGGRLLIETPNFKPVAALALFAGFYFRRISVAVGILLLTLMVSDAAIGFYPWKLMAAVYGSMMISIGLGRLIHRRMSTEREARQIAGLVAASLVMSTSFFLLTNGAVWLSGWYAMSWEGLVKCYSAALPFYRFTLLGDLCFTGLTFGAYYLSVSRAWQLRPRLSAVGEALTARAQ